MHIWIVSFFTEEKSGDYIHFLNQAKIWRKNENIILEIVAIEEFLEKKEIPDIIIPRL
jgi:hypothetical protein